jgi:hypothetical protein
MATRNRTNRKSGSFAILFAIAGIAFLAAGALPAISDRDNPGRRRQALRESLVRTMDIFAVNYGDADWSEVAGTLFENPSDPANPAFMSVPLSLANVYLNRYETAYNKADLERSVALAEWVAWNRALWERREGSGAVVSYLDITVKRLEAECDIGGFEFRIGELSRAARGLTADEADAIAGTGHRCGGVLLLDACIASIQPYPTEADALASRAALLAAAASLLSGDSRAAIWGEKARQLATSFPSTSCGTSDAEIARSQGALTYLIAGGEVPSEFDSGWFSAGGGSGAPCASASAKGYETAGPVAAVRGAEAVDLAIRDSRVVAFILSETYLWLFPPGSQCEASAGSGDIVPGQQSR